MVKNNSTQCILNFFESSRSKSSRNISSTRYFLLLTILIIFLMPIPLVFGAIPVPYPVFARTFSPGTGWSANTVILTSPNVLCYDPFPEVAVNNQGCAVAAWVNDSAGFNSAPTNIVQAATYAPKTGWSAPVNLPSSGSDTLSFVQLAINSIGNALVIWTDSNRVVQSAMYTARTKNWSATLPLSNDSTGELFFPNIAFNSKGDAIVAWVNDNTFTIQATLFNPTTNTWSQVVDIGSTGGTSSAFSIEGSNLAINNFGDIVVVWENVDTTTNNQFLQARIFSPATGWGAIQTLADESVNSVRQKITLNDAGQACALWFNQTLNVFQASLYDPKNGWLPAYNISDLNVGANDDPSIMINSSGNIMVAWTVQDNGNPLVQASLFNRQSGAWTIPVTISSIDSIKSLRVSYNSLGNGVIVWNNNDLNNTIQAVTYSAAQGWSAPVNISSPFTMVSFGWTAVALNSSNNAIAVFGAAN